MTTSGHGEGAGHVLGRKTLGPVFACFAQLLLRHATRLGCSRLAFVARDGDLLMQVVARLLEQTGEAERPSLSYLHLSRRSTTLPARRAIGPAALAEAMAVRAGGGSWREMFEYLGLPLEPVQPILDRLGVAPDSNYPTPQAIAAIAADPDFQDFVAGEHRRQRSALADYLARMQVGWGPSAILVDIGWRGSILNNLNRSFSAEDSYRPPPGAFFGLWSEDQGPSPFPPASVGLIADMRRRRNVVEGSAWYAAFLLEAVCRADEGTTLHYEYRNGEIEPVLAEASASRQAEAGTATLANDIRQGILEYMAEHGGKATWRQSSDAELRRSAQRTLFRLAFFPTEAEIEIGTRLAHTEGHAKGWSAPLIAHHRPNPLLAPRAWLAGLSSPWRSGYVLSTGGPVLTGAFLLAESALLAMPPAMRAIVTSAARRIAGTSRKK